MTAARSSDDAKKFQHRHRMTGGGRRHRHRMTTGKITG